MPMESLETILQWCCNRPNQKLHQQLTEVLPPEYHDRDYHFRVWYARKTSAILNDFEKANITVMPIGREPDDRAPDIWRSFKKPQAAYRWRPRQWYAAYGIGISTGEPSGLNGANWHDIEFTHTAILHAPDAVAICVEALIASVAYPLITLTKEGGLRFSCRVTDYLHPRTETEYVSIQRPTRTDPKHQEVFVNISGEADYSLWDTRYEVLMGSVFNPPTLSKETLLTTLIYFKDRLKLDPPVFQPLESKINNGNPIQHPQTDNSEASVSKKIDAIRVGELSPLSIKRPTPILSKQPLPEPDKLEDIVQSEARVIGISTGVRHPETYREIETAFAKDNPLLLSMPTDTYCIAADKYHTDRGASIGAFHQPDHLAYAVEDVPYDELLKNPFGRGNLCIDSERYRRIYFKGGNSHEILCPKCPVYAECQDHGFHAQFRDIPKSDIHITEHYTRQPLTDPRWRHSLFLDRKSRVCIVSNYQFSDLFVEYRDLSLSRIKAWIQHWEGSTLGDFAHALLNAIEINENERTGDLVARVRKVFRMFEIHSDILNAQMCQVNVAIKEMVGSIGMSIKDAAAFGLFDISTIETIRASQRVYRAAHWTFFHQLKYFFEYYQRDTDAPMRVTEGILRYYLPPILHPDVKKLVIVSPVVTEKYVRKAFPYEKIAVYNLGSADTLKGNRVYQLRDAIHPPHTILNYDQNWDQLGLSKNAARWAVGIYHEIQKSQDKEHTLLWQDVTHTLLKEITQSKNVKSINYGKHLPHRENELKLKISDADTVWCFGLARTTAFIVWRAAKILFGDEDEPIDYRVSLRDLAFKDPRLEEFANQVSLTIHTGMLSYVGFENTDKTLILNTAFRIPGITDAPETQLFDWEDFEIAGGLANLDATIAQREAYETRASEINGTSMPYQIMQVLGVDRIEANRILRDEYGRKGIVPVQQEILSIIREGETEVQNILNTLSDRHPRGIRNALTEMVNEGIIQRTHRGTYKLIEEKPHKN